MSKQDTIIDVITVFEGSQDATDVFADLIAEKYRENCKIKRKEYLVNDDKPCYNTDEVHGSRPPSGLCA